MATTTIKDVNLKIGTETQFQSKLKDLPLNTLVGTTDPIQEGELDTSIITKLNKAENALPKPTNDTTGSAGQVLKKTANGSEWGDAPSGGGKLYRHRITVVPTTEQASIYIDIINTSNTQFTENEYFRTYLNTPIVASFDGAHGTGAVIVRYVQFLSKYVIEGAVANLDNSGTGYYLNIRDTFKRFEDTVTEL